MRFRGQQLSEIRAYGLIAEFLVGYPYPCVSLKQNPPPGTTVRYVRSCGLDPRRLPRRVFDPALGATAGLVSSRRDGARFTFWESTPKAVHD